MHDQVNPGYFKAKREGLLLPVSPMSRTVQDATLIPGECKFTWPASYGMRYEHNLSGCLAAGWKTLDFPAWPVVDRDALLQSALARAQTDAWDTATFLAEFGKTIEMLTTFYGRWKLFYERLLRAAENKRKRFKTFGDAFSNAWLEARYGFRPLYYDMLSIQETIKRMQDGTRSPLCRGWEAEESSPATASSLSDDGTYRISQITQSGLVVKNTFSASGTGTSQIQLVSRTVGARASVGVEVTTRELTLFDPAITAWELVPFSFVMDWFITVGDAVSAFSPFATGAFKYATYSLTQTETRTITSVPYASGYTQDRGMSPSVYTETTITSSRVPATVTPTLSFKVNVNASKIVDLVALAWSLKLSHLKILSRR
nr:MAG: hypothetical protein [Eriocheir sinensis solspivirus 2]